MPKPTGEDKPLTAKEEAFCNEYPVDLHQANAARRAGYASKNAARRGYELMQRPHVKARIREIMADRQERTQITADMVIQGLYQEANDKGPGSSQSARVSAWTQLGRHLGLFTDKLKVGDLSYEEALEQLDDADSDEAPEPEDGEREGE